MIVSSESPYRSASVLNPNSPYKAQLALLVELLPLVARESCFALKGGTAINLFIRDLPRVSVDIDLTYLPVEDREQSLTQIDAALRRIAASAERAVRGTHIRCSPGDNQCCTKLVVRRDRAQVVVEVSPVLRGSVREASWRDAVPAIQTQFGAVRMPVMHVHDVYAGKLCAALDRQHPRDLFDILQFESAEGLSRPLVESFLIYLLSSDRPMSELLVPKLQPLEPIFEQEFVGMALIPVTVQALEAVRLRLISGIHALLTDADREFLVAVKKGTADWSSFWMPAARNLPGVRWKLQNIERMQPGKRQQAIAALERALHG
jgi:predicted nucleotidyltransferase component of viral defense system